MSDFSLAASREMSSRVRALLARHPGSSGTASPSTDSGGAPAVCPVMHGSTGGQQHESSGRSRDPVPPPPPSPPSGTDDSDRALERRHATQARFADPLYYGTYLKLGSVLGAQEMESAKAGFPAHDEHLFIVIHQVYELWFKQIIFELDACMESFRQPSIPEPELYKVAQRLHRVTEIQRLLVQQLTVLETMTPSGFLEFRDFLFPASGFQSAQFRLIENKLGLKQDKRLKFGGRGYCTYLNRGDSDTVVRVFVNVM